MKSKNVKKIIVLGIGGNCTDIKEALDVINRSSANDVYKFVGYLDDNISESIHYLGPLSDWKKYHDCFFINGIGSTKTFLKKEEILSSLRIPSERYETILHPSASISSSAEISRGCVVFQNVVITSNVHIGKHVMILPNSVISHDSRIGDYSIIAGCVCISGDVTVGKNCYLGAKSSLRDGIRISDGCLIGCGANVVCDTPPATTWVGNPARIYG